MMSRKYSSPQVYPLASSVGSCGTNNPQDVKKIQKMIINAGYYQATRRSIQPDGVCGSETMQAIIWYQRLLNLAPSGLVHPMDLWFMQALTNASIPGWRPRNTAGPLIVRECQFTFDNEGVDYITAVEPFRQPAYMPYFSRILHHPETSSSGVTLGRGYDMGGRSCGEIYTTLKQAGIEEYKSVIASKAAGLKGKQAGDFIVAFGSLFGEITHQQQIRLFEATIKDYINTGKRIFNRKKASVSSSLTWENIHIKIKEIFIDSLFQGCYSANKFALLILEKNIEQLRYYLNNDSAQLNSYGRNIKRLRHIYEL